LQSFRKVMLKYSILEDIWRISKTQICIPSSSHAESNYYKLQ
jgi:hypothetical protein